MQINKCKIMECNGIYTVILKYLEMGKYKSGMQKKRVSSEHKVTINLFCQKYKVLFHTKYK